MNLGLWLSIAAFIMAAISLAFHIHAERRHQQSLAIARMRAQQFDPNYDVYTLRWIIAVLTLRYFNEKDFAEITLDSLSLGIYSRYDVDIQSDKEATFIRVEVKR